MERNMKLVVERKLASKLQSGMTSASQAIERLTQENKLAKDFLFEVGNAQKGNAPAMYFERPVATKSIEALLTTPETRESYTMHPHAIRQTAEKLQVPFSYKLNTLINGDDWQRDLGVKILNIHNMWLDRNPVLIRAIGHEIRGVLSSNYRRLDSEMIFNAHLDAVYAGGAQLSDGYMDDTRIMMESLIPDPIEIKTPKNGTIWMLFGQRLMTSDYGDGALSLSSFMMQGVCLNGLVRENALRQVHLGAKLSADLGLSQRTYQLDSETTASAIKDLTANFFKAEVIRDRMLEIKAASEIEVDPYTQLKALFSTGRLLKNEMDEIGKILMRGNPMNGIQGESTLWKLTQGITSFANDQKIDMRRKMELQQIAGDLFNDLKN